MTFGMTVRIFDWFFLILWIGYLQTWRKPKDCFKWNWMNVHRKWTFRMRYVLWACKTTTTVLLWVALDYIPTVWNYLAFFSILWAFYDRYEDDWWKRQLDKSTSAVKSIGHRLVVVPSGAR